MKTVRDILKQKGSQVWTVIPGTKVYDALKLMAEKNIGAVLVTENDEIKGILSERDYARKVVLEGHSSQKLNVEKIMSTNVLYVSPEAKTEDCMALMIEKKLRHLPVLEDNKLIGIISIGDVVNVLLNHKDYMIDQLEKYITNRI
ncbi:MAG: CBS domain-containing protein [Calditrichaceae bacterium]|jgi:CBS domain-containing protein